MANIYTERETTNVGTGYRQKPESTLSNLGANLSKEAKQDFDTSQTNYRKGLTANASATMKTLYETYSSNPNNTPDNLKEQLAQSRSELFGKVEDNDLKAELLANYDLQSESLLSRANIEYNKRLREENKKLTSQSINDENEFAGLTFGNLLSSTSSPDDWVNYNISRERILKAIDAKQEDGTDVYTNSEKKQILSQIEKTNRKSVLSYFNGLNETDKYKLANEIITGKAMLGNKMKLSEVMNERDIQFLKSFAKQYKQGYDDKVQKGIDEKKASEKTSIELIRKEQLKDRYTELEGKKKNFADANLSDIYEYRAGLDDMFVRGEIDEKTYKDYKIKSSIPARKKMEENLKSKEAWYNTYSNLEYGTTVIQDRFEDTPSIYNNDIAMVDLQQQVYQVLKQKGINPDDTSLSNRSEIAKIANDICDTYASTYAPGRSRVAKDSARALTGDMLIDFKNGKRTLMSDAETPYKIENDYDGNQYKVFIDKDGNELERIMIKKRPEEAGTWERFWKKADSTFESFKKGWIGETEYEAKRKMEHIKERYIPKNFTQEESNLILDKVEKYPELLNMFMNEQMGTKEVNNLLKIIKAGKLETLLGIDINQTSKLSPNEGNIARDTKMLLKKLRK